MAHFAEIDENNLVTRVLVTDNDDPNGDEGYEWLLNTFGGRWIKTSYNAKIRKNYAGIGYLYDENLDAFIPPKPFESWVLDQESCQWIAPKNYPNDGSFYIWDENAKDWISG